MIDDIQSLLTHAIAGLKDHTALRQLHDWVEMTTPYLDHHHDALQIYVKRDNGGYLLTDDGYVLEEVQQSGCQLDSPRRQTLLQMMLKGFGVHVHHGALEIHATAEDFALRTQHLLQAMLAVHASVGGIPPASSSGSLKERAVVDALPPLPPAAGGGILVSTETEPSRQHPQAGAQAPSPWGCPGSSCS